MENETARQFFEGLQARVDQGKAAGLTASYLFDVEGSGKWKVDVDDGKVTVTEGEGKGEADCTIKASEETFIKIVRGEQNATAAYMTGKLKLTGDLGTAMKLQQLF